MIDNIKALAQPGVVSDANKFVEYLTFMIHRGTDCTIIQKALNQVAMFERSISQKDLTANLTVSIGVSNHGWNIVLPNIYKPVKLASFTAMEEGSRSFPATDGDLFFMIKSDRIDLNFQLAKYIFKVFGNFSTLVEDIQGFRYLDNRDMVDFVDGSENPTSELRLESILVKDERKVHVGGSYLTVQRYVTKERNWVSQSVAYQEKVIGRTKFDDIELNENDKPAWAHNNKSKVFIDGVEQKILRQNRPYGNALEHGTMFIGFCSEPEVIQLSLKQMIYADELGNYDRLLDFVEAKTGTNYFMLSQTLLNLFD
ncbi:Dyp-type peroxidase [Vibrio sp. SS-MA-C1-2]|uniref:Dyp-type peroxidase n=1 Tax=Vibrio sp. SS-MA-C1-2 TaxID=2908646 RepID=UPI001F383F1D|nr:Dyp-type peroxidase [Vibrio sp. SS-MA-C1-2]UJF16999.1 Dyp-type peroxidase [Vibrio sp. SS-MA-C1-2]